MIKFNKPYRWFYDRELHKMFANTGMDLLVCGMKLGHESEAGAYLIAVTDKRHDPELTKLAKELKSEGAVIMELFDYSDQSLEMGIID